MPQLQTTFVKGLGDPARGVRVAAASNLGALAALSARADALVAELASGAAARRRRWPDCLMRPTNERKCDHV